MKNYIFGKILFRKRLPSEFGDAHVLVTPRADARVLKPGFAASANDLMIVARQFVKPGDRIWDIGSNLGIFSALAAARAGSTGRVTAIEADPSYAAIQSRTFDGFRSHMAPCQVIAAAVSDQVRLATFSVSNSGTARSSLAGDGDTSQSASLKTVVCITLDWLLDQTEPPQFVKIDVEGADIQAYRGAERLLSGARPTMYLEGNEDSFVEMTSIFGRHQYKLFRLNGGNIVPLEGFGKYIVAIPSEKI